ncbi:WAHD domain of WASH complex [Trypanosoma brucei equiperdum]|uniref:WAHD domain of WASH complex n=1 Tax=Trypanosoma brucei equiperdum TaxID=630700 RepID=A0A3L6L3C4_9TRYP|nr:WAHD domain of WASH complex [Trypanosoma brucei equiperdum]
MYKETTMTPIHGYTLPVPLTNGGYASMLSVIRALGRLDQTSERVFGNIEQAVERSRETLEQLQGRIAVCADQVEQLQGRREAMVVKSRVRFPKQKHYTLPIGRAPCEDRGCVPERAYVMPAIIQADDSGASPVVGSSGGDSGNGSDPWQLGGQEGEDAYPKPVRRLDCPGAEQRLMKPQHPLQEATVKSLMPLGATWRYHSGVDRGLGRLPAHLVSVSSLLLFNTRENLYKEYHEMDVLTQQRQERVVATKQRLGTSDVHRDYVTQASTDEYAFVPLMEEVANLMDDLPENLPLEGIAEVAWNAYSLEDQDNIAPSGQRRLGERGDSVGSGSGSTRNKKKGQEALAITAGPDAAGGPSSRALVPSGLPPPPPPPGGLRPPGKAPPPPPPPPPMFAGKMKAPPPPPIKAPPPMPSLPGAAATKGLPIGNAPPAPPPPPPPPPPGKAKAPAKPAAKSDVKPAPKPATKSNLDALSSLLANRRKGILGMHSDGEDEDDDHGRRPPASGPSKGMTINRNAPAPPQKGGVPPPPPPPPPPKAPPPKGPPPKVAPPPPPPPPPPPAPGKLPPKRKTDDDDDW